MLTLDDANTIMEKYKDAGFWYTVDFNQIDTTIGTTTQHDFIELTAVTKNSNTYLKMDIVNNLWDGKYYIKKGTGFLSDILTYEDGYYYIRYYPDMVLYMFMTLNPVSSFSLIDVVDVGLVLNSPTQIPVVNGSFDDKLYIHPVSSYSVDFTIDGTVVEIESDSKGRFFRLPAALDCVLGVVKSNVEYLLYRVTFREFKTIPNLFIDTLYRGTSQQISLSNEETGTPITEFQAYYQGRKLKDNIVTLPYDCDGIVDIVIDLQDNNYPPSRVKLKAYTELYYVNSQAGLEEAISNGIHTVQVTNRMTRAAVEYVTLSEMDLTDLNLVDSFIHLIDSKMTNVNIIDSEFVDRGNNTITSSKFKDTAISNSDNQYVPNKDISHYNDCTITGCTFAHIGIILSGSLTGCTLSTSLIISDGTIEVTGNTFTGKYNKDYFPAQLYLTGDYTVKQNTFNLSGTWSEPAFDMCIIKTIDGFNPSMFINDNTFSLNITYGSEQKDTFYYNLVDDDKIYARRLS